MTHRERLEQLAGGVMPSDAQPGPPSLRGETGDRIATLDAMMQATQTVPAPVHLEVIARMNSALRALLVELGAKPTAKTHSGLIAELRAHISREMQGEKNTP